MGQRIEIIGSRVVGDVLVVDTDRGVSGQDGSVFESPEDAQAADTFPARLARRIFDAVTGVTNVFSASNTVVVGRDGAWDEASVRAVEEAVGRFFVFYGD